MRVIRTQREGEQIKFGDKAEVKLFKTLDAASVTLKIHCMFPYPHVKYNGKAENASEADFGLEGTAQTNL